MIGRNWRYWLTPGIIPYGHVINSADDEVDHRAGSLTCTAQGRHQAVGRFTGNFTTRAQHIGEFSRS